PCRVRRTGEGAALHHRRPRRHDHQSVGELMNLLYEIDRSLPLVQLAVSVMRGASTDPPGKEGLTRLLVRLMRRTASGRAAEELDEHLDSIGASLGVDVGCSSCGFAGSTIARSLDAYIDVVAGVVAEPGLDAEELSRL